MKSKEELKKLFENGDKPTQENFWEWQDSYWHKDEKLPMDVAGIYKIKGSIANLAALNALTNMSEGDVYNLLDTGDNYVYVLNLNNTGVAGWDKFSGIVDLSTVNLQTVLNNGGTAVSSDNNTSIVLALQDNLVDFTISDQVNAKNSILNHQSFGTYLAQQNTNGTAELGLINSSNSINFFVLDNSSNNQIRLTVNADSGFTYANDYSSRFIDRSLVDKGYVDTVINASIAEVGTNYLPLSGTEVGKPLNGMIEVDGDYGLIKKGSINDPNEYSITLNDFSGVKLESPSSNLVVSEGGVNFSTGGTGNSANFGVNSVAGQVLFNVENANYRTNHIIDNNTEITEITDKVSTEEVQFIKSIEEGITSNKDFTDIINPLAYVQKKYVDEIIASDTSYAISGINPVTQASLNTEFPNAKLGFEVYSTVNDLIYKKINNFNEWCKIPISLDVEP